MTACLSGGGEAWHYATGKKERMSGNIEGWGSVSVHLNYVSTVPFSTPHALYARNGFRYAPYVSCAYRTRPFLECSRILPGLAAQNGAHSFWRPILGACAMVDIPTVTLRKHISCWGFSGGCKTYFLFPSKLWTKARLTAYRST